MGSMLVAHPKLGEAVLAFKSCIPCALENFDTREHSFSPPDIAVKSMHVTIIISSTKSVLLSILLDVQCLVV